MFQISITLLTLLSLFLFEYWPHPLLPCKGSLSRAPYLGDKPEITILRGLLTAKAILLQSLGGCVFLEDPGMEEGNGRKSRQYTPHIKSLFSTFSA